jgi:YegS/Rv2252/BmrU family lipid kinase
MTPTCCLVVNPAAGGGRATRLLPEVRGVLESAGVRHEVHASASLEHATELAVAAAGRGDVAVAFGGDGMVGALAGAVAGAGGVFGIIPAGRGNDFARTLGIPFDVGAAARRLADGRPRSVDLIGVGRTGAAETIVAGSVYLGIPAVAAQIAVRAKVPPGKLAYPVAALRAVAGWRTTTFRLELDRGDTREFAGGAVVVANSRYFGAGMMVAPHADPEDGVLDVVFIRGTSKIAMIHALTKIKKGTHVSMSPVGTARAREVTVTVGRAMPGGADGEALPCAGPLDAGSPLRIRALPRALRMIG